MNVTAALSSWRFARTASLIVSALMAGCAAYTDPPSAPRKENAFAVTASHVLISFNAGLPATILSRKPLTGMAAGERLLGIDYRVARGQLYALSDHGKLYRIDTASGQLTPVGTGIGIALRGNAFGFDFNPTVDRIRVVSDTGQNLRLHPDTGAAIDADPQAPGLQPDMHLRYAPGDTNSGRAPRLVAAAYSYNKENEKITTNYAIDAQTASLVLQGSREGAAPVESPNTGLLTTIGPLAAGSFETASFDIADISNAGFAALTRQGATRTRWYLIDLSTGRASLLGTIGADEPIVGVAIEP